MLTHEVDGAYPRFDPGSVPGSIIDPRCDSRFDPRVGIYPQIHRHHCPYSAVLDSTVLDTVMLVSLSRVVAMERALAHSYIL